MEHESNSCLFLKLSTWNVCLTRDARCVNGQEAGHLIHLSWSGISLCFLIFEKNSARTFLYLDSNFERDEGKEFWNSVLASSLEEYTLGFLISILAEFQSMPRNPKELY